MQIANCTQQQLSQQLLVLIIFDKQIKQYSYEKSYKPIVVRDKMVENPWIPVTAIIMYGVFIVIGRAYFKNRQPVSWRKALALWNLGLSVFSAIGFCRILPHMLHNFYHYSLSEFFCFDPESMYGSDPVTGMWMQLFVLSKFPYVFSKLAINVPFQMLLIFFSPNFHLGCDTSLPSLSLLHSFLLAASTTSELLDTFFIVVHKKPLIFLHWYHHISVLAYCWHSYVFKAPPGIIFAVMNYAVHAIMYFYYFLMAVKLKPKWFNSMYITAAQISQMVVGVIVTALGFIIPPMYGDNCNLKKDNNTAAMIMYGSYLMLFLQFFFKRYTSTKGVPKKSIKTATSKKQE